MSNIFFIGAASSESSSVFKNKISSFSKFYFFIIFIDRLKNKFGFLILKVIQETVFWYVSSAQAISTLRFYQKNTFAVLKYYGRLKFSKILNLLLKF